MNLDPFWYDCSCLCGYPCQPAEIIGLLRRDQQRMLIRALQFLATPTWRTHEEEISS